MLNRLQEIVLDLKAAFERQPTYGWAVVTSVTPLMIRYDAQTEPIAGTPDRLVAGLAIGDRVWCQRIHRRDIILGRGGGPLPPRAGTTTVATGALSQIGGTGVWGAGVSVVIPVKIDPRQYVRLSVTDIGSGWGNFEQYGQSSGLSTTTVLGRFTQVNSSSAQNISFIWEIVTPNT